MAKTDPCPSGYHPRIVNGVESGCDKDASGTKYLIFPQLAISYMLANDPAQVRALLVSNGLVVNIAAANSLTDKQIADLLLNYYYTKGPSAFSALISQFVPNRLTKNWTTDPARISAGLTDVQRLNLVVTNPNAKESDLLTFWHAVVGGSSTVIPTTVTTTTATSPAAIGYVIGGVLVLAVLAYIVTKS